MFAIDHVRQVMRPGVFAVLACTATAGTVTVPDDHADLMAAVRKAADGDTIMLAAGRHVLPVAWECRDVTLTIAGSEGAVLIAREPVRISRAFITFRDVDLEGTIMAGEGATLLLDRVSGTVLEGAPEATILGREADSITVRDSAIGSMFLVDVSRVRVEGSAVIGHTDTPAIDLVSCPKVTITNSTLIAAGDALLSALEGTRVVYSGTQGLAAESSDPPNSIVDELSVIAPADARASNNGDPITPDVGGKSGPAAP